MTSKLTSWKTTHTQNSGDTGGDISPTMSSQSQRINPSPDVSNIPEFVFNNSNRKVAPQIESCIPTKTFLIKRKHSGKECTITFSKEHISSIFEKIKTKFNIKKAEDIVLYYHLRESNGGMREISVMNDAFAEEELTTFFIQADEMSTVPLIVDVESRQKRERRPCEEMYSFIITKNFSVNKKFCQLLIGNPKLVVKFQLRRRLISLVLGERCLNLLNPAHYCCHITGCEKIMVLGSFSKLTLIVEHWKEHASREIGGEGPCSTMVRRYQYIKNVKNGEACLMNGDLDGQIEELQSVTYQGKLITPTNGNFRFIQSDTKFKGRNLVLQDDTVEKILSGDTDVLLSLPEPVDIRSYFSPKRKNTSKVAKESSASTSKRGDISFTINVQDSSEWRTSPSPSSPKSPSSPILKRRQATTAVISDSDEE